MPNAKLVKAESGAGYVQHDAANVLFGKEIGTGELKIVQGAYPRESEVPLLHDRPSGAPFSRLRDLHKSFLNQLRRSRHSIRGDLDARIRC
jgi:hypothetical protein